LTLFDLGSCYLLTMPLFMLAYFKFGDINSR
jgi:hypothetical protein